MNISPVEYVDSTKKQMKEMGSSSTMQKTRLANTNK